jgi:copper resistance protein B
MHEPLDGHVLVDQLEYRVQSGHDVAAWDAQAWYGGDYHKVFFKTEGERSTAGEFERAETQLLYSRLVGHYWDLQAGVRYDFRPNPSRAYGVVGLQGLAPGFFELDLQGFVSNKGDVSARFEAEYDLLITQRLVLQPKVELDFAAQPVRELGIGSGLSTAELGLRLRYEFLREFAPYIGVNWERKVGRTATFARQDGESVSDLAFVVGIRFWY